MNYKFIFLLSVALLPGLARAADTVRPAVAKYFLEAETSLKSQKYDTALSQLNKAEAVGNLSAYENLVLAQLRGSAAGGAGQYQLAAASYKTVLASPSSSSAQKLLLTQVIAGFEAQAGDNVQTAVWVEKYVAAGGKDARTRALGVQAEYNLGHYQQVTQDVKREGADASNAELQLAASAAEKLGDKQAYFDSLLPLLKTSPSPAYWNQAISLVQTAPKFPDSLTLSVYRLRFKTGTLNQPGDYEDYAERAILAGQPREAKKILDAGFATNLLTPQTDGGHAVRLRTLAEQKASAIQSVSAPPGSGLPILQKTDEISLNNPAAALAALWSIEGKTAGS